MPWCTTTRPSTWWRLNRAFRRPPWASVPASAPSRRSRPAAGGAVFPALFRNDRADPAIIGVSSGAALGAVVVLLAGGGAVAGGLAIPAVAFVGALATAFLVYRLARIGPTVQVATLLLAGI